MSEKIRGKNLMYVQQVRHLPHKIADKDKLIAVIENELKPQRYAIILHDKDTHKDGTPEEPGYHVMLCFQNARTIEATANHLGDKPQYITKWNGDVNNGFSYLIHRTRDARKKGKYQYDPAEVTANFDFPALIQTIEGNFLQAKIKAECGYKIDDLLNALYVGVLTKEEVEKRLTGAQYGRYRRQIEDVWARRLHNLAEEWRKEMAAQGRKVKVIWIYGVSGVGKTRLALAYAEKLGQSYYITGSSRDLFQNYKGEHTLIIDELRPNVIPYQDLLRLTDPFGAQVMAPARYHDRALACDTIIVTSPYDPIKFYFGLRSVQSVDSYRQLLRRIELMLQMDARYIYPVHFNAHVINYYGGVLEPIPGMEEPNPYSHKDDTGSPEDNAAALFRDVMGQVQGRKGENDTL